jgi:transposase InsO family protein
MRPGTRVGYDFAHAIVDHHSRLAYAEIHPDQRALTVAGFLERALACYEQHGVSAKRLMTDNARVYVKSRDLRRLLAGRELRHLTTQPYRPHTNGKVERFHQTMAREWPTDSSTTPAANAPPPCHTGSTTTTPRGRTAQSAIGHRSAAFTTSVARTARPA